MASSSTTALLSSLLLISLIFSFTEARDFLVGGKTSAWEIPSSETESLNKWAESTRFQIGDSLVWTFDPKKDSVLQVSRKDYLNCNKLNPIAEYKDGNTKVELDRSGPFYFISGAVGHCEKGQKLIAVVLSAKHHISPAPSPAEEFGGPAVAPTSGGEVLRGGLVVLLGALLSLGLA